MDLKVMAIEKWCEIDLILLKRIDTKFNYADGMTKVLGKMLHQRHMDFVMGYKQPKYVQKNGNHHHHIIMNNLSNAWNAPEKDYA